MPNLKVLLLESNALTGPIPSFENSKQLTSISLGNNLLDGPIPASIGSLVNLVSL
jgi:hypothetical protein